MEKWVNEEWSSVEINTNFGIIGLSGFQRGDIDPFFFLLNSPSSRKVLHDYLIKKIQARSFREIWVQKPRCDNIFGIFGRSQKENQEEA